MDTLHATSAGQIASEVRQVTDSLAQATEDAGTVELDQTSVGRLSRMDTMQ